MNKNRWMLAIGAVAVAVGVGVTLAFILGGGPKQLTHAHFVSLWQGTRVGQPEREVLARWPKNPYQHYTDSLENDCYEFADVPDPQRPDMPQNLYNLCFKGGVLRTKQLM